MGIAPIGHKVTVVTPTKTEINVIANITLSSTATLSNVQQLIEEALEKYFLDLRKTWEDSESLTVRIAQIEAIILNVDGVIDISTDYDIIEKIDKMSYDSFFQIQQ